MVKYCILLFYHGQSFPLTDIVDIFRFQAAFQMLLMQAQTPRSVISLMVTQSMVMPQTLLVPPSNLAGTQRAPLLVWYLSLHTTQLVTLLELATLTMPMATHSLLAMATSWCPPITMLLTTMLEPRRDMSVDLLLKRPEKELKVPKDKRWGAITTRRQYWSRMIS